MKCMTRDLHPHLHLFRQKKISILKGCLYTQFVQVVCGIISKTEIVAPSLKMFLIFETLQQYFTVFRKQQSKIITHQLLIFVLLHKQVIVFEKNEVCLTPSNDENIIIIWLVHLFMEHYLQINGLVRFCQMLLALVGEWQK